VKAFIMSANEFLTVKELSEYLNVKGKTIYSWVGKKVIPCYQLEGVLRFKKPEIDQWLLERRSKVNNLVLSKTKELQKDFYNSGSGVCGVVKNPSRL